MESVIWAGGISKRESYCADETQCRSILKDVLTKFLRDQVTRQAAGVSRHSTISIPNCRRDVTGPRACEGEKSWGSDGG